MRGNPLHIFIFFFVVLLSENKNVFFRIWCDLNNTTDRNYSNFSQSTISFPANGTSSLFSSNLHRLRKKAVASNHFKIRTNAASKSFFQRLIGLFHLILGTRGSTARACSKRLCLWDHNKII